MCSANGAKQSERIASQKEVFFTLTSCFRFFSVLIGQSNSQASFYIREIFRDKTNREHFVWEWWFVDQEEAEIQFPWNDS